MLRFIHCADLHFDRSFEGLHLVTQQQEKLISANHQVLKNIVTLAIQEQVDFLLLAGDTFHQNRPSLKTQHHFFEEMNRLNAANIPVYMCFGNHDYYERERYWFEFPENVHLFTEENVHTFKGTNAMGETYAISSFSYRQRWLIKSMLSEFPERQATYQIGMYHGDSNGINYAPFQLIDMKQKKYDYWALGHIHVPMQLSYEPPIVYPGTPQGHSQKEKQLVGVYLVTLGEGAAQLIPQQVAEYTWEEISLSLQGVQTQREALSAIYQCFHQSAKQLIKLKVTDTEALPIGWLQEEKEMIDFLNDFFAKNAWQQIVYKIVEVGVSTEGKISLEGQSIMAQLLLGYQEPQVFASITEELNNHPVITRVLSLDALREMTLESVKERLATEFDWREEDK